MAAANVKRLEFTLDESELCEVSGGGGGEWQSLAAFQQVSSPVTLSGIPWRFPSRLSQCYPCPHEYRSELPVHCWTCAGRRLGTCPLCALLLLGLLLPKAMLAARILAAESQLAVALNRSGGSRRRRHQFTPAFRMLWVAISKVLGSWEELAHLMKPETVKRWHTTAFRLFWRWRSRGDRQSNTGAPSDRGDVAGLRRRDAGWGSHGGVRAVPGRSSQLLLPQDRVVSTGCHPQA